MRTLRRINLALMATQFPLIQEEYLRSIVGGTTGNWDGTCFFYSMGYVGSILTGNDPFALTSNGSNSNMGYLANAYMHAYASASGQSQWAVITGGMDPSHASVVINSYYTTAPCDVKNSSNTNPSIASYKTEGGELHGVVLEGYDEAKDEYNVYDPKTNEKKTLPGDTEFEDCYQITGIKGPDLQYYDYYGYEGDNKYYYYHT